MGTLFCLAVLCAAGVVAGQVKPADYAPTDWTVFGPFPNESLSAPSPSGATRAGFDKIFGPEAGGSSLPGKSLKVDHGDLVDFGALFDGDTDNLVAYAQGTIELDRERTLHATFGSDDAAKVFLNGKLVHSIWTPGRAAEPSSDSFILDLPKGKSTILVKVENATGGWGFYLSLMDEEGLKAKRWLQVRQDLADRAIVQVNGGPGHLLVGDAFPRLGWRDTPLIDALVSSEPMKVRWFDAEANEVTKPTKMGLYAAYIETATADGKPIRRLLPFCRVEPESLDTMWGASSGAGGLSVTNRVPAGLNVSPERWKKSRATVDLFVSRTFVAGMFELPAAPEGALLLAYLQDPSKPIPTHPLDLQLYGAEYLLKVRRKVEGLPAPTFRLPTRRSKPAPVLRFGTAAEAGMKADAPAKLKKMLAEWSREEGKPFSVVMARNGVVFLHDGFGVDKNAGFYPASIGKTLFGTVFAQFVDQGLIDPDEPIGKYLPDFPTSGDQAVTFRNCVTHTSGISGHGTYGGFWNPTLDNAFSMRFPDINPGERYAYGGDGNNLAGKALELISGKPMARLMKECLFDPVDAPSIIEPDLGYAIDAKAIDLAKVGQMLVNRGSYGNWQLFSEETFQKFLPTNLSKHMPRLGDKNVEWGYAVSYMPDPDGPREKGELGPNVIGHGSASSSIFRVDLDSGLVVVMGRYGIGKADKYNEYRAKTMRLLRESIVK